MVGVGRVVNACVLLAVACMAVAVDAASYDISDASLTVQSFDGAPRLSKKFASKDAVDVEQLLAQPDDVVKFDFTIVDGAGKPVGREQLPHQAWIVLEDTEAGAPQPAFTWPLRVRPSRSSAAWSLRMDKLSPEVKVALARAGALHPFRISVLLGSFASEQGALDAIVVPFLDLSLGAAFLSRFPTHLESAREKAEAKDGFLPWPKHAHTFATEPWQTMPPAAVSLGIAIAVFVGPWLLLTRLWHQVVPRLAPVATSDAVLLASVYGLEALAVVYWIGTSFYIVLPTALLLTIVGVVSARQALSRSRL